MSLFHKREVGGREINVESAKARSAARAAVEAAQKADAAEGDKKGAKAGRGRGRGGRRGGVSRESKQPRKEQHTMLSRSPFH